MLIMKFGGTSLGSPERIHAMLDLVRQGLHRGARAVVCSAFGGVTEQLLAALNRAAQGVEEYRTDLDAWRERHELTLHQVVDPAQQDAVRAWVRELASELTALLQGVSRAKAQSPAIRDGVLSFGERAAAFIIAAALRRWEPQTAYLDARRLVKTDAQFGKALVDYPQTEKAIRHHFSKHTGLQVITGFIGSSPRGETTTLGRGSSDYTAALFAAALSAETVEIWTDVDGVMTADPRKVPGATSLPHLGFEAALELCHFGAKVLYPPTIGLARRAGLRLWVRNSFRPHAAGTRIGPCRGRAPSIAGVTTLNQAALLRLEGVGLTPVGGAAPRLFHALERAHVPILMTSHASCEHAICVAVYPGDLQTATHAVRAAFTHEISRGQVRDRVMETDCAILAVVGDLTRRSGVAAKVFNALEQKHIDVIAIAQGASKLNLTFMVKQAHEIKALTAVHNAFFGTRDDIHLFLIGPGLVGGALLDQISQRPPNGSGSIRLAGIINRKHMSLAEGLNPRDWRTQLEASGEPANLKSFCRRILTLGLTRSVVVDCTAEEAAVTHYSSLLANGVSVVAANKLAAAGPVTRFEHIRACSQLNGARFLYEANVGAGLPVLSSLRGLVASGDRIHKIQAVLSGTLSFIFGHFNQDRPFSEAVREAHRLGLTEPHPREDLSGRDVARKMTIILREIGRTEVVVTAENLAPDDFAPHSSPEIFLARLGELDERFEQRRTQAETQGKALRYLASFERGRAVIGMTAVGPDHPAYHLSGTDNLVSIHSQRYHQTPLVIRGPGAGAEVTAAQVYADILRATGNML